MGINAGQGKASLGGSFVPLPRQRAPGSVPGCHGRYMLNIEGLVESGKIPLPHS